TGFETHLNLGRAQIPLSVIGARWGQPRASTSRPRALSDRSQGCRVTIRAQPRYAEFDGHLARVVRRFPYCKQWSTARGLHGRRVFLGRNDCADFLFSPLQALLVDLFEHLVQRSAVEVLLFQVREQRSWQVACHDRHGFARNVIEPLQAVDGIRLLQAQGLGNFTLGPYLLKLQDFAGRIQPAAPHFFTETTELPKVPRSLFRADDRLLASLDDQQAFRAQGRERLPNRHLADAKVARYLSLRQEHISFAELA